MEKRKQECYHYILEFMKKQAKIYGFNINPNFVITDFELGEINSLTLSFPLAIIIGCWFHFTQAIQTWFTKNKPGHGYNNNQKANEAKALIMCLPWLPIKFVTSFWNKYIIPKINKAFNNTSSSALISYINSTWFNRFEPKIWNIYNQPLWTNNPIENNNKFLNKVFGYHPNKIEFIQSAFDINNNYYDDWVKFMQVKQTHPIPKPSKIKKKQEFLLTAKKYWNDEIIKSKKPQNKKTIEYCQKYMQEIMNIRIKYSKYYQVLQNKSSEHITIEEYYKTKSLTNSKRDLKQCKNCDKQIHSSKFEQHKELCRSKCKICHKFFKSKYSFEQHLKKHKQKNDENNFFCPNSGCIKKYKNKETLQKHLIKCKELFCTYKHCNYSTYGPHLMKAHLKSTQKHNKRDGHKCKKCNKIFMYKNLYNDHIKEAHSNFFPFKCEYCKRQFKRRQKLNIHNKSCVWRKFNQKN